MRCRGVQEIANAAYSEGFPFPALLSVAQYCVPDGVKGVSGVRGLHARSFADQIRRVEVREDDVPHVIGTEHLPSRISR
jgi:hypothetical protein